MPAGAILEGVAKAKAVITYAEISSTLGFPEHKGDWKSHPLCAIFETLDQDDANHGRPFRTSVVVHADPANRMPGPGFFEALERLKGVVCRNVSARQRAWISELNAAHQYSWP